ncbi:uncharacterized protein RAG0_01086 [Rhynchosporium agropyri]|uniref:Uncharacterized protein n=1 Tax=Rhynchosporium agropyri TaxID=914238 RepID=A0A1E1JVC5_9HELO|nr:uncharacterized protein RAG0_01086 [Rhynchosporium agropyri]
MFITLLVVAATLQELFDEFGSCAYHEKRLVDAELSRIARSDFDRSQASGR